MLLYCCFILIHCRPILIRRRPIFIHSRRPKANRRPIRTLVKQSELSISRPRKIRQLSTKVDVPSRVWVTPGGYAYLNTWRDLRSHLICSPFNYFHLLAPAKSLDYIQADVLFSYHMYNYFAGKSVVSYIRFQLTWS